MRSSAATAIASPAMGNIDWHRVKRNDPCPCGSGKKFKSCHYPQLRQEGVI
jgi:preprotein translocase subunit SecA